MGGFYAPTVLKNKRDVLYFPADRADLHRCRSGRFLFSTQIAPLAPRCKREFCYNVTCYMLQ